MSSSIRQQKFSRLIQKELSEIFTRDRRGWVKKAFITLTEVRVSSDLSIAKIYVAVMSTSDQKEVLAHLKLHKNEIRRELGRRIRRQVRAIPDLIFYLDEVEEQARRLDSLIANLTK